MVEFLLPGMKSMMENPNLKNENDPGSPDKALRVKNFIQRELMKRYLAEKLGPEYMSMEEEKRRFELKWAEKSADKFREIFNDQKEEFFRIYDSKDPNAIELLIASIIDKLKKQD